ncbi:hypothetical protein [Variovorax soli]|uniref:Uncharacterized protein n=1 Tax=Variovorax soli TaxID=376815 RepID=A0ABU1NET1_9BURK|nr:hypothetical protein [Variovorax soli]MDR6536965.1 hypothetical protein [Variovorax soli]
MTSQEKAVGMVPTPATAIIKKHSTHFLIPRRFIKAAIVVSALRGWLPYGVADWLIQRGGLSHV